MAIAEPVQNKMIKTLAMMMRKGEIFLVVDDIMNSFNVWAFCTAPHIDVAVEQVLKFFSCKDCPLPFQLVPCDSTHKLNYVALSSSSFPMGKILE